MIPPEKYNVTLSTGKDLKYYDFEKKISNTFESIDQIRTISMSDKHFLELLNDKFPYLKEINLEKKLQELSELEVGKEAAIRRLMKKLFSINEPIILDEAKRIKRLLQDIYNDNNKILTLNSWEFEEMIAELLVTQGYKVELTKRTKDNGYDIIALLNLHLHNPVKFLVECKRYSKRKVGVEIIRSFKEVIDTEKANRGIIVTTSYFTKGALQKQAEIPYLLDYRDKDKVIEWVQEYFSSQGL
jgi:HJR/Mrr/RecB family endonuclease